MRRKRNWLIGTAVLLALVATLLSVKLMPTRYMQVAISGRQAKVALCAYEDFADRLGKKDQSVEGLPLKMEEYFVVIERPSSVRILGGLIASSTKSWMVYFYPAAENRILGKRFGYEIDEACRVLSAKIQ